MSKLSSAPASRVWTPGGPRAQAVYLPPSQSVITLSGWSSDCPKPPQTKVQHGGTHQGASCQRGAIAHSTGNQPRRERGGTGRGCAGPPPHPRQRHTSPPSAQCVSIGKAREAEAAVRLDREGPTRSTYGETHLSSAGPRRCGEAMCLHREGPRGGSRCAP